LQGTPFAAEVHAWTVAFIEELVTVLAQAMQDGVTDAAAVIRFFLQQVATTLMNSIDTFQRLASSELGPEFSQMGVNMLSSYIMKTFANTQQPSQPPQSFLANHITQVLFCEKSFLPVEGP
jgi:hypothetical protein